MNRANSSNYRDIFINDIPLLDVRTPSEHIKGSFPSAINIPILNDKEKSLVGLCAAEKGLKEAIALGNKLVDTSKNSRVESWIKFIKENPNGYLYCAGLRGEIAQQWLKEAGTEYPQVIDGYKGMRQFLLTELDKNIEKGKFLIVSGKTGCGKTRLLKKLKNVIDLEGLANHRGSSFGAMLTPQPNQVIFENKLSISLMKQLNSNPNKTIVLEDESRRIGNCSLPDPMCQVISDSPVVLINEPLSTRVDMILQDYVITMTSLFKTRDGEALYIESLSDYLLEGLNRIVKKLGLERKTKLDRIMREAIEQQQTGDYTLHREWIRSLLSDYYDPLYDKQLLKSQRQIIFNGTRSEVQNFIMVNYEL